MKEIFTFADATHLMFVAGNGNSEKMDKLLNNETLPNRGGIYFMQTIFSALSSFAMLTASLMSRP